MDKLQIGLIGALIFLGHPHIAILLYAGLLASGTTSTNYATLSSFVGVLTYGLYGITGLLVSVFTTLALVCSGAMYWYDLSLEDIEKTALEQAGKDDKSIVDPEAMSSLAGQGVTFVCSKTGLTPAQIHNWYAMAVTYYNAASGHFDTFCDYGSWGITGLHGMTANLPGFILFYKYLALAYVRVLQCASAIQGLKQISKLGREISKPPINDLVDDLDNELDSDVPIVSSSQRAFPGMPNMPGMPGGMPNMPGGMPFDMGQIQEFGKALTPEQRDEMSKAAMAMLGNIDMSQMAEMFSAMGDMGGMQGMSPGMPPSMPPGMPPDTPPGTDGTATMVKSDQKPDKDTKGSKKNN